MKRKNTKTIHRIVIYLSMVLKFSADNYFLFIFIVLNKKSLKQGYNKEIIVVNSEERR